MFIVFPRLLADLLGFSGAVGLSVIVSAMEVRTSKVGIQIFISGRNCKSANFWAHSAIASPKISLGMPVSKPLIHIFLLIIRKSQILHVCQSKIHKNFHYWTQRMKYFFSTVQP
jgi:hypothetical protein